LHPLPAANSPKVAHLAGPTSAVVSSGRARLDELALDPAAVVLAAVRDAVIDGLGMLERQVGVPAVVCFETC